MKQMKKRMGLIAGIVLVACLATGCSNISKDATENTFILNSNGSITDVSVEDYTDSSFAIDDLEDFVTNAVNKYNQDKGEDSITFKSYEAKDKKVKLVIEYDSIEDYNAFNNTDITIDTVANAKISGKYKDSKGEEIKAEDIDDTLKVLTVDTQTSVYIKNMKYYNNDLEVGDNDAVTVTEGSVGYIIYK